MFHVEHVGDGVIFSPKTKEASRLEDSTADAGLALRVKESRGSPEFLILTLQRACIILTRGDCRAGEFI